MLRDGESALLVPPDATALADAILRLRAPELRQALSSSARSVFERHFSEHALTAKMAIVLDAASATRARPRRLR